MSKDELLSGMNMRHALFGLFFAFDNQLQATGDIFYEEITCKQFFLLICLSLFREEPPTINQLAEIMGSSHQNVKQIVLKLEKAGFVRILTDEADRRKQRIVGTEKLLELSEKYGRRQMEFLDGLYEGIDDKDIEITYATLRKIEQNLTALKAALLENKK